MHVFRLDAKMCLTLVFKMTHGGHVIWQLTATMIQNIFI